MLLPGNNVEEKLVEPSLTLLITYDLGHWFSDSSRGLSAYRSLSPIPEFLILRCWWDQVLHFYEVPGGVNAACPGTTLWKLLTQGLLSLVCPFFSSTIWYGHDTFAAPKKHHVPLFFCLFAFPIFICLSTFYLFSRLRPKIATFKKPHLTSN